MHVFCTIALRCTDVHGFKLLHPKAFNEAMDQITCYYSGLAFFGYSHKSEAGLEASTSTGVVTACDLRPKKIAGFFMGQLIFLLVTP